MPSGVLTHPNTVKDPKRLRGWNAAYGGSANSGKVAILEESMTFTPISIPQRRGTVSRNAQISGHGDLPHLSRAAALIGDLERATFSNIESQNISFAVHTIRPWLVRMSRPWTARSSRRREGPLYVRFNLDGLMRGRLQKSRMEGYAIARQNGWMSANDIRGLENLNPLSDEEGGNLYLVNGNMVPHHHDSGWHRGKEGLMRRPLTLGSLFDGIGGFPPRREAGGDAPVWASEIEPFPHPGDGETAPRDETLWKYLLPARRGAGARGRCHLRLPPCRDLSIAGKREGPRRRAFQPVL